VHVLVATDGKLDASQVADFAVPLAGADGLVSVLTVIEIPRRLLSDLREVMGQMPVENHTDADAEYVEMTDVQPSTPKSWPGDDAVIQR
jgi:nucleotide-binding universal stress UspA family protein